MPIMQEAVKKEEWERMDKGLPPLKKEKEVRPDPEFPKIDNHVKLETINLEKFVSLEKAERRQVRNAEGVVFNGFDVQIRMKSNYDSPKKDVIEGWMIEGEFQQFFRLVRDRINLNVIKWF